MFYPNTFNPYSCADYNYHHRVYRVYFSLIVYFFSIVSSSPSPSLHPRSVYVPSDHQLTRLVLIENNLRPSTLQTTSLYNRKFLLNWIHSTTLFPHSSRVDLESCGNIDHPPLLNHSLRDFTTKFITLRVLILLAAIIHNHNLSIQPRPFLELDRRAGAFFTQFAEHQLTYFRSTLHGTTIMPKETKAKRVTKPRAEKKKKGALNSHL